MAKNNPGDSSVTEKECSTALAEYNENVNRVRVKPATSDFLVARQRMSALT